MEQLIIGLAMQLSVVDRQLLAAKILLNDCTLADSAAGIGGTMILWSGLAANKQLPVNYDLTVECFDKLVHKTRIILAKPESKELIEEFVSKVRGQ